MEYKNDNKFYFEIEKRIPGHLGRHQDPCIHVCWNTW